MDQTCLMIQVGEPSTSAKLNRCRNRLYRLSPVKPPRKHVHPAPPFSRSFAAFAVYTFRRPSSPAGSGAWRSALGSLRKSSCLRWLEVPPDGDEPCCHAHTECAFTGGPAHSQLTLHAEEKKHSEPKDMMTSTRLDMDQRIARRSGFATHRRSVAPRGEGRSSTKTLSAAGSKRNMGPEASALAPSFLAVEGYTPHPRRSVTHWPDMAGLVKEVARSFCAASAVVLCCVE